MISSTTPKPPLFSYLGFRDAVCAHQHANTHTLADHYTSIINNLSHWKHKRNNLIIASIANKTPIAQFIVDTYCQYALKHSASINDFMENSRLFNLLREDKDAWYTIRKHLSDYVRHIYKPIHKQMFEEDDTLHAADTHNMADILYYISNIHASVYRLKKVSQIDVVFIPKQLDWLTDQYFINLGIKFESISRNEPIRETMKRFNDALQNDRDGYFKRCVLCILPNRKGYIFEPLTNHSVHPDICHYTEMPWICNTKADIFPDLNSKDVNSICISLHRHESKTERVYLSYGPYCTRVYKRNLISILKILRVNEKKCRDLDWAGEIQKNEFEDAQYHVVLLTCFGDLKLVKPDLNSFWMERLCDEHRWSKILCTYFVSDRAVSVGCGHSCVYTPTAMEYYEYLNDKVNEYYTSQGVKTKCDQFLKYIEENGLENCSLEDNLGLNKHVNDCVLLNFDTDFPMMDDSMDRAEFIFRLLQNIYFFSH
eukprot:191073_1